MTRAIFPFIAVLLTGSLAFAADLPPVPAIIVVDSSLAGDPRAGMAAAAVVPLLAGRYSISPPGAAGTIWPDMIPVESCRPDGMPLLADGVETLIAEGRRLFFREMDGAAAMAALDQACSQYFAAPCLRSHSPGLQAGVCRAGVLLVRLQLLAGRTEAAATRAAFLASRCSRSDTAAEDVPPEVIEFMEGTRPAPGAAKTCPVLALRCAGSCRGVIVDDREVACPDDACSHASIDACPGMHFIAAPDASGSSWYSGGFTVPGHAEILMVAPGVRQEPSGELTADGLDAGRVSALSVMTGTAVLAVVPAPGGAGWQLLAGGGGQNAASALADFTPEGNALRMSAVDGAGLEIERKAAWPWPWVSGALSAGFLTAGIVLNVYAERALADAEDGQNTMGRYEGLKAGAIAGYVTAGAGVLATILLAVLRPLPDQSVLIVPSPAGFALNF